ncbi:MAG: phage holin family protein [Verrucomicrobium sp.]|nr:phage holin family protein [Verrucomicrobium sp.]
MSIDTSSPIEKPHSGVTGTLRRLLAAVVTYAEARFELACVEGKGALGLVIKLALAAFAGLLFTVIAYVLFMFAFVDWVATHWWSGHYAPAASIIAVGHLIAAAGLALWAARAASQSKDSLFHATRREFNQDKQWLTSPHSNSRN